MKLARRDHTMSREMGIELNASECALLLKAAALAEEIRGKARLIDPTFGDSGLDTDLGQIEHNSREFARDAWVSVLYTERTFQ